MTDTIRGNWLFSSDPVIDEENQELVTGCIVIDYSESETRETEYTIRLTYGYMNSPLLEDPDDNNGDLVLFPAIESDDGYVEYREMGVLHREDGPAVKDYSSLYEEYWVNGKRHRLDGPAVIHSNGDEEYWICGVLIFSDQPKPDIEN